MKDTALAPWLLQRTRITHRTKIATDWPQDHSLTQADYHLSNFDLKKMFDEDQKARISPPGGKINWSSLAKEDSERRLAVRKMIAAHELHTAQDFNEAAFIFQHGSTPDDFLLAHTLAIIAVSKGEPASTWIAAATLDRYLQSIHQPQIYGTQFHSKNGTYTLSPYNSTLITDELRTQMGVPKLADQKKQAETYTRHPPYVSQH